MPDLPAAPVSNVIEWLAVFGAVGGGAIITLLLTKTIPSAFEKVEKLGERFERSHRESTEELVEALERLGDKVEASSHVR